MKTLEDNRAFVKAFFEVVNENGMHHMNEGACMYFEKDGVTPICLIGRALAKLGMDLKDVQAVQTNSYTGGENNSVDANQILRGMGYDPIVVAAASHAQKIQDGRLNGWSTPGNWGEAALDFVKILHSHKRLEEFAPGFRFSMHSLDN